MSTDPHETLEERRAARSTWPIAFFRFGEEPSDDLSAVTTPSQRVAMVWFLARTAWTLAGRPWPRYDRAHIPARLFRPGTPPPDDDDAWTSRAIAEVDARAIGFIGQSALVKNKE